MFNANSELSQNHTEKQIMKFITIVKGNADLKISLYVRVPTKTIS